MLDVELNRFAIRKTNVGFERIIAASKFLLIAQYDKLILDIKYSSTLYRLKPSLITKKYSVIGVPSASQEESPFRKLFIIVLQNFYKSKIIAVTTFTEEV